MVIVSVNEEEVNQTIIAALADSSDFVSEFECLLHKLQPNLSESFKKYNLICHDLYNLLSKRFRGLEVQPFGSTLTGLGFSDSDVDVYLGNVKKVDKDEVPQLINIKKTLQQSGKFGNCLVIPGAKIPLIKCLHLSTGIKIDINIKNKLGVLNSRLIQYYLSIDGKVKQVMLILKFWAKCHKVTGQNHLLTNYSLVLMFIFFLQQEPYKFPSVAQLQQNCPNTSETVWNGEFVPNYNFQSDKLFSGTPLELLQQFFEFYSNFPFHHEIVCPFLGRSVSRFCDIDSFVSYKQLKETFKLDSALCVQDPFEHVRNVTSSVSECVLDKFVQLCQMGKNITETPNPVIYKLLTVKPPEKSHVKIEGDLLHMELTKTSLFTQSLSGLEWFEFVDNFLTICLRDFLAMKVKLNSNEDSNKRVYVCTSKMNLWHARKTTAKQLNLDVNMTLVDREWAITTKLKELTPTVKDLPDILGFKLTVCGVEQKVSVTIEKINSFKKSHGKSFNIFFAANFPHWLESYEKDMSKAREDAL